MVRTKVFKSGNSNAVRFPASFAVEPGMTVEVREEQGRWIVEAVPEPVKKIDISGFAGKAPWLKPLPPELREFEERPSALARRKAEGDA
jgi:antitoxin VapB